MQAPVVAGYRCGRLLGVGGMGAVFLAQRDSDDSTVAIKFIRSPDDLRGELGPRMRRELEVSMTFAHPYLPKILDGGTLPEGQGTYIVMEFLDGLDLAHAACKIQITDSLLRRILGHMAEALSYIHARGLLHRDVKPANIFLARGDRTVLLDFGLAYDADRTQLTRTGTVLGTVPFMAPEQIAGKQLMPAADIYGLGASAVAALTGMPPFEPADVLALVTGVPHAPPLREPPIRSLVSGPMAALILRCLSFEPGKRFATADDLARALAALPTRSRGPGDESGPYGEIRPWSGGKPAPAPATSGTAAPPRPRTRLHRLVAAVTLLTALVLPLVLREPRTPASAPSAPPVSVALREALDARWPPAPEAFTRLDRALTAADMTSRYALPSTLAPQARALTWLALKARDEGRYDDAARFLTLALERCGPFCLATSIHDATALTLEMARLAGTTAVLGEQLDALAEVATEPRARGRFLFAARQSRILGMKGTDTRPEAWMAQARLLEPMLRTPPPSVRPVEVAVALMTALAGARTTEARSLALRVMESFPRVGPDVPTPDLISLRHQTFRALTQEPADSPPRPRDASQVGTAVVLADDLAALLAESGDPRRAPILLDVAYGLERVGRRGDAWRVIRTLASSPLLSSERCDVHRTQASLYTNERDYPTAMTELRAALALAPDDVVRSSIERNIERLTQLQLLMPAAPAPGVAERAADAVHSAPGGSP